MGLVPFQRFVLRTPVFPLENGMLSNIISSSVFDEGVCLSSPDLHVEKNRDRDPSKKEGKLKIALGKYAARTMTRCTPFGLFAGCSIGKIGEDTSLYLVSQDKYTRFTRLDMHYMGALIEHLNKETAVRLQLKYYPNDSIYNFGGSLRYVEYYYHKSKRVYSLSGAEPNDYIDCLLSAAKNGATVLQLSSLLIDDEIDINDATEFIHELIDNQLLKSELELSVTGVDPLLSLLKKLENISSIDSVISSLRNIYDLLRKIDSNPIGTITTYYNDIEKEIKKIGVGYEPRYLFQTDLFKPVLSSNISQMLVEKIVEALTFLNKLTETSQNTQLEKFKEEFYSRYENRSMPLLEVLDRDLGIGYPAGVRDGCQNPLIQGLPRPIVRRKNDIRISAWGRVLLGKYIEAIKNNKAIIELTDDDVKGKKSSWTDTAYTLSCLCQIVDSKQICINSVVGGATKFLARFCHLNSEIESLAKEIAQKEHEINPDAIFAEIVHLPESRTGNILFRPVIRDYEIPYLCKPGTTERHVIPLTDLLVSIRQGELVLTSKTLGKDIIPCLSTAHNYHYNTMPIYRFLCDMYNSHSRKSISFTWGGIDSLFNNLPRVIYKDCILSVASWYIQKETLKSWLELTDGALISVVTEYRNLENIPHYVVIPDNDNKLFIDLTDSSSIQIMLDLGRKREGIRLEEFLFNKESAIVKGPEGSFCNEFIFSFYKSDQNNVN